MRVEIDGKKPVKVPSRAKQAGDTPGRWSWTEPSVWTLRMLKALEEGVKGGKWFSLWDKVISLRNLRTAFEQVRRNKGGSGVDHQSIKDFSKHLDENLLQLHERLKADVYFPQAIRRVWIPKPGSTEKRPLGIPTVRDRIVQTALVNALEPIFERDFAEQSYGFRPGRGCKGALRRVSQLLQSGYTYVLDADLKGYFDSIPHQQLMERVEDKIADGPVLKLIEAYLHQHVLDEDVEWTPEDGTPQGAVISPLLSNLYLDPLDHLMHHRGHEMVRYADDFVILCRSQAEAESALEIVRKWTEENGLVLHPIKTRVVDANLPGGFDFLGYHFERGYRWPSEKAMNRLKEKIRKRTRRTDGRSLSMIIKDLNLVLRGWYEYFKHGHRIAFRTTDSWIRMRLRSILRKRNGGHGRGHGADHNRWPNVFFADQGLMSLLETLDLELQSLKR